MAAKKTDKLLLIFDLPGVLGYVNKNLKATAAKGKYNQLNQDSDSPAKPVYKDSYQEVYARPKVEEVQQEVLLLKKQQRKVFDVGIWSSLGREDTEIFIKHLFGRYFTNLLFVSYTGQDATNYQNLENAGRSKKMGRNLSNVFGKYQHFDETNTLMISNHYNQIEEFQQNDVILPEYHPVVGETDFLDDKHMILFNQYLKYINALELKVAHDVRRRLEMLPYNQFCMNATKNYRYNSYTYGKNDDPNF